MDILYWGRLANISHLASSVGRALGYQLLIHGFNFSLNFGHWGLTAVSIIFHLITVLPSCESVTRWFERDFKAFHISLYNHIITI